MPEQKNPKIDNIPSFLNETPSLTKPNEEARNRERLMELIDGMDRDDASVICSGLAAKYPVEMFTAMVNYCNDLRNFQDGVMKSIYDYKDKRNSYV